MRRIAVLTLGLLALQAVPASAAPVAAVWIVTSGLSLDRSEKSVAPAGEVTGPAETGPVGRPAPPLPHASAAPDVVEQATCSFVRPRARAHLELTYSGDRIVARFVLHQMTTPGHRWRIVLRHASTGGTPPHADDWHVIFEGIRLARGDSGDITVQQSVADPSGLDFVAARARDRQTGQFCRVKAGLL